MLIDPAAHPGPALWQGVMMIVLSVWAVFALTRPYPSKRAMRISGVLVLAIGIALMVIIMRYAP